MEGLLNWQKTGAIFFLIVGVSDVQFRESRRLRRPKATSSEEWELLFGIYTEKNLLDLLEKNIIEKYSSATLKSIFHLCPIFVSAFFSIFGPRTTKYQQTDQPTTAAAKGQLDGMKRLVGRGFRGEISDYLLRLVVL